MISRLMRVLMVTVGLCAVLATTAPAQEKKPAGSGELTRTFTTKKPRKMNEMVSEFVIDLIHKNTGGVQDQYRKLTAATEEAAGGRYQTNTFEGILWFVVESSWNNTDTTTSQNGEYIYLARQQLVAGFHRGYSVPVNVVAQVRVKIEYNGSSKGASARDDEAPSGTKVTLSFEGFLDKVPTINPEN